MITLNSLEQYRDLRRPGRQQSSAAQWVRNNLFHIAHEWRQVLDSLDEQVTVQVVSLPLIFACITMLI